MNNFSLFAALGGLKAPPDQEPGRDMSDARVGLLRKKVRNV